MRIQLLTEVGRQSGACRLVHEAEVPPFVVPPRVVLWGARVFVREIVPPHEHPYVEAFAFFLEAPVASVEEAMNRAAVAESELAAVRERVDLDVDEFMRIKAELYNAHLGMEGKTQEMTARLVYGLCDRAVAAGRQRVPLIEQRDRAVEEAREQRIRAESVEAELRELRLDLASGRGASS